MRSLLLILAVLVLAAGCANNRATDPEIAPSRQASLNGDNPGWSVPPGQKTVTDPGATPADVTDPAQAGVEDEAAAAAADRARREEAARQARARLHDGQSPGEKAIARGSESAAQPHVKPLVPAFPVRMQEPKVLTLKTVHFAFDNYDLTEAARALLDENAHWMLAHPEVVVRVEGHADERGTPEYNLALGERRAKRVREYLIGQGVPPANLVTVSYGEEMPIDPAPNEQAWAKNRRAEFTRAESRQVSDAGARGTSG